VSPRSAEFLDERVIELAGRFIAAVEALVGD
jgi:hypothetical protein